MSTIKRVLLCGRCLFISGVHACLEIKDNRLLDFSGGEPADLQGVVEE
jgi:hypothetical protein